jgi:hypothetical protein
MHPYTFNGGNEATSSNIYQSQSITDTSAISTVNMKSSFIISCGQYQKDSSINITTATLANPLAFHLPIFFNKAII